MSLTTEQTVITEPGVYTIPEDVYHRDPVPGGSLSFSGAKRLLAPSCPAKFRYERDNGRPEKRTFDFGHAAHSAVLGVGAPVVVVDADSWRTDAAKNQRKAAYAEGKVPLLAEEAARVEGMAQALRQHEIASALFNPEHGAPEQSLFRVDPETGVWLRSRFDWLPHPTPSGRLIVGDYKSTISAEPAAIAKSAANYAYHQQAAWYADMALALGLSDDVSFVFVFQEKTPPYLVTPVELDDEALRIGRLRNREAIDLYAECVRTDTWPGYTDGIELISLPFWATSDYDLDLVI